MKTHNIYHVIAATPGCWKVIVDGAEPTFHSTETEAVAAAREWAMIHEPSQVVIHKADGSIEEEYMMKMDAFPHSPSSANDVAAQVEQSSESFTSHLAKRPGQRRRGSGDGFSRQGNASL